MGRAPKSNLPKGFQSLLKVIGGNIRSFREQRGLTQAELAKRSNISTTTLNEIETKTHRDIRLATLYGLAETLKTPIVSLFLESDLKDITHKDREKLLQAGRIISRITKKIDNSRE